MCSENQDKPCWVKCPDCDEYWCYIHDKHAHDCTCRDIEWWSGYDMFPYVTTVAEYQLKLAEDTEAAETADQEDEW